LLCPRLIGNRLRAISRIGESLRLSASARSPAMRFCRLSMIAPMRGSANLDIMT